MVYTVLGTSVRRKLNTKILQEIEVLFLFSKRLESSSKIHITIQNMLSGELQTLSICTIFSAASYAGSAHGPFL